MSLPYLKELVETADQASKDMVAAQEERQAELEKISDLMKHENAKPLMEMLNRDLEYYVRKAVADNNIEELANVRAYMRLIDKLNTGAQLDAIAEWAKGKIKELEQ